MTEIPPDVSPPPALTRERVRGPLARFEGAEPPAPDWFRAALADAPERRFVTSQGTNIELLTWGEVGKPGVLLLHGAGGHADWWAHIAPFLAQDYRVAAISMAGNGRSEWRAAYSHDRTVRDLEICARAAGLYESGTAPVYVGHSFGGHALLRALLHHPEQLSKAVIVDTAMGPPPAAFLEERQRIAAIRATTSEQPPPRLYPTFAAAMDRFRLIPPQPPGEIYVTDLVARHALTRDTGPDGASGWRWVFDPDFWEKFDAPVHVQPTLEGAWPQRPMAYVYGEQSLIITNGALTSPDMPAGPKIGIPQSHHHVMLDQPLALVATLRTLLSGWALEPQIA